MERGRALCGEEEGSVCGEENCTIHKILFLCKDFNFLKEHIQKRKEMAKSKTVEGATKASDNMTKEKTPPASPNPKVPTPKPTPEGTL